MTRPRTNMLYRVLERRLVPSRGPVLADEVIELTSEHAAARCTVPLRRVAGTSNRTRTCARPIRAIYAGLIRERNLF